MKLSLDNGHYYLHVCFDKPSPVKSCKQVKSAVALDPGVRTFQSTYSTENRYCKIGDNFA